MDDVRGDVLGPSYGKYIICTMDDVREFFLGPPYGTTPSAVIRNEILKLDPLEAVKTFKRR